MATSDNAIHFIYYFLIYFVYVFDIFICIFLHRNEKVTTEKDKLNCSNVAMLLSRKDELLDVCFVFLSVF